MRRRARTTRRARSGGFRGFAKRSARKLGIGKSTQAIQVDAMLYGAGRSYLAQLISPLTSKIPFGGIADEIGCGAIDYLVAKNMTGMVRDVALKGLTVENARLGEAIVQGGLNLSGGAPIVGTNTSQGAFSW